MDFQTLDIIIIRESVQMVDGVGSQDVVMSTLPSSASMLAI